MIVGEEGRHARAHTDAYLGGAIFIVGVLAGRLASIVQYV